MNAGTVLAAIQLALVVAGLVQTGLVSLAQLKVALGAFGEKWATQEATPENIEAARLELLAFSGYPNALDDPYIRERLAEIGIEPGSV